MSDSPPSLSAIVQRWVPSPRTAMLLASLVAGAFVLRASIVTSKLLIRAKERFALARQQPAGSSFKWEDAAVLGTHYSTWLMIGLGIAALMTLRWWFPRTMIPLPALSSPQVKTTSRYRLILLSLILLAASMRLPLATGSLWWDELWNVKYATLGEWRQEGALAESVAFQQTSWARATWYFNKPTNHPVLTLPSKFCHTLWQKWTDAAPGRFSEIVLRLPVLLSALAALLLTARLATRLAGERAGLSAAALIALHPWLIRYSVDARSYGLTLVFFAAALYSLERATAAPIARRNAWWWAHGACQFLLMWSHVFAHFSLCVALFVAAAWLIRRGPPTERSRRLIQLVVINLTAACLFLMAFLPNLLQALTWGERNDDGNLLTGTYLLRTLAQMTAGMEPALTVSTDGIPVLPWWGLILALTGGLVAVVAGFRFLIKCQPRIAFILGILTFFTILFLMGVRLTDFYFYHRFMIALSIPLILLIAIGLSRLPRPSLTVLSIAGFAALTYPQTQLLLTRSYAPFRETVADLHANAAMLGSASPISLGYGLGSHVMQCYDPLLRDVRDHAADQLQAAIDQARREQRPLFVVLGYESLNRLNLADGFRLLDDPALFERISTRYGLEPEFTFHLLRLKPPLL